MNSIPLDHCIETERLLLRISNADEIDFVWDASRHAGFNAGLMCDKPESKEELNEIAGDVPERWKSGSGYLFTFHEKTGGALGRIVIEQRCGGWNAGFWTHPKFQGAGYASEALGALLRFSFEELGLNRVDACHADWNLASRRVLERNGFRFKGHFEEGFEKDGEWIAQDTLAITRDQWLASRGGVS